MLPSFQNEGFYSITIRALRYIYSFGWSSDSYYMDLWFFQHGQKWGRFELRFIFGPPIPVDSSLVVNARFCFQRPSACARITTTIINHQEKRRCLGSSIGTWNYYFPPWSREMRLSLVNVWHLYQKNGDVAVGETERCKITKKRRMRIFASGFLTQVCK